MNKFLRNVDWIVNKERLTKAHSPSLSPIMNQWTFAENHEFIPLHTSTRYTLSLILRQNFWIKDDIENKENIKSEIRNQAIKRLHHEIFGDIESLLNEAMLHAFNDDIENIRKTLKLCLAAVKGGDDDRT